MGEYRRPMTAAEAIKAEVGEEEYQEMVEKLELLAGFAEEIKQTPVEDRAEVFGDEIVDEAIEMAEDVYDTIDSAQPRWYR